MFPHRFRLRVLLCTVAMSGWLFGGLTWTGHLEAAEEDEQAAGSPVEVFLLGTQFHPGYRLEGDKKSAASQLTREILRQGLLIAARDELGLPTRDATLREPFVDWSGKELEPLEVTTAIYHTAPIEVRLCRKDGDNEVEIWQAKYRGRRSAYAIYTDLVSLVEADSRTGVVEALRKAGYGTKSATEEDATTSDGDEADKSNEDSVPREVPEEVERQLSVMHFVPQFAAVRWAHEFNGEHGQTPASLSVLVRGYAHLAMLSECYWNSMSRAYKARALLYAERMTVAYPDSSEAVWHRAYARALVGLHGAALAELEEIAKKFGEAEPAADGLPGCMKLIKPCCRYDSQGLLAVGTEEGQQLALAHYLNFRVGLAINDARLLVAAGRDALVHCPDTYEIYDTLSQTGFLRMKRWSAQAAPAAMSAHLPKRLKAVDGLPEAARLLLRKDRIGLLSRLLGGAELPTESNSHLVAAALVEAGRVGEDFLEPSWDVPGRMIQEENFLACVLMMFNMSIGAQTPLREDVAGLMPMVEGHPYAGYVEHFGVRSREQPEEYAEIISNLRIVDPQFHMHRGFRSLWYVKTKDSKRLGCVLANACQRDFTAYGLIFSQRHGNWATSSDEHRSMFAKEIERITPYCPETLRTAIAMAREPTEEQLLEWEERAAGFPGSLHALGRAHWAKRQYKASARCLEKSVAVSPSVAVYRDLAGTYEAQGKPELFIPTLERCLEAEDFSLDHASIHSDIAHRLMDEHKWEEAKPHALYAAETYSAWGMTCAARCLEGLEDWENSELWARRASESYGGTVSMTWYLWCRRNERGDLEAARQLARKYAEVFSGSNSVYGKDLAATICLLEGDRRKALESMCERVRLKTNMIICVRALLLAVELEDQASQDEMSEKMKEFFEPAECDCGELDARAARLIGATLRSEDPQDPDLEAMAGIMRDYGEFWKRRYSLRVRTNFGYIFGRILELDGQPEKAKEYFRQVVDIKYVDMNSCAIAAHALARLSRDEDP